MLRDTGSLSKNLGCNFKIENQLIFLYDIEADNFMNILNFIVFLIARYIYVCKCIDINPTIQDCIIK